MLFLPSLFGLSPSKQSVGPLLGSATHYLTRDLLWVRMYDVMHRFQPRTPRLPISQCRTVPPSLRGIHVTKPFLLQVDCQT